MFCLLPPTRIALGALPELEVADASGLFNLMRNLGGAIGIAMGATILNNRTNFHFARLAEHLHNGNPSMLEFLGRVTHTYASASSAGATAASTVAMKKLWLLTFREAQVQSFADAFIVVGICLAIATLLVPLLRKVIAVPSASVSAH